MQKFYKMILPKTCFKFALQSFKIWCIMIKHLQILIKIERKMALVYGKQSRKTSSQKKHKQSQKAQRNKKRKGIKTN